MTTSFEEQTLKERIIYAIEQADDISNEISVIHEQLSEGDSEYEVRANIYRTFEKHYGGSDEYGNREEYYTLKTKECVVDTLTKWNENGEPLYFTESQELSELADYIEDYFTVK